MYKASLVVLANVVAVVLCYHVDTDVGLYGGDVVKEIQQAPFMASIFCNGQFFCGGSLIHPQFVLTAAHCLTKKGSYVVQLNSTMSVLHKQFQYVLEENIFVHKQYIDTKYDYDIGLIKLDQPVDIDVKIKIADSRTILNDGDDLDVYGWGETENFIYVKELRHETVPFMNFEQCRPLYERDLVNGMTSRIFCAGNFFKNRGICSGDSGGPVLKGSVQVGLVSFSKGLCGYYPSVYSRISAYNSWINEYIEEYKD